MGVSLACSNCWRDPRPDMGGVNDSGYVDPEMRGMSDSGDVANHGGWLQYQVGRTFGLSSNGIGHY